MRGLAEFKVGAEVRRRLLTTPHPTRFAGHLLPQGEKDAYPSLNPLTPPPVVGVTVKVFSAFAS